LKHHSSKAARGALFTIEPGRVQSDLLPGWICPRHGIAIWRAPERAQALRGLPLGD
jgi:hypothetical protein